MFYRTTRRSFVKMAATGLVGLAAAGDSAVHSGEPRPRRKFTMCLSCGAVGVAASSREAIELAHRFGFEAVEPSAGYLGSLSGDALSRLRAEMKADRLVWGAEGLPVEFRGTEAAFQDSMRGFPDFARQLQRAGVTRVATWLNPCHDSLDYAANLRQHARRLREAAKVLSDHGVRLGLEYVGPKTSWTAGRFPFVHSMAGMKQLIAEIGSTNVGFLLDSWHWYTAHETEADLLTLRGAEVVCCHLNDAPKGIPVDQQLDNHRDLPAATGVIDLRAFLGALVKIGYDGPVLAEPFRPELAALPRDQALAAVAASMKKAFALVE
jgi:sugar phosphate isomerase/epimerase